MIIEVKLLHIKNVKNEISRMNAIQKHPNLTLSDDQK